MRAASPHPNAQRDHDLRGRDAMALSDSRSQGDLLGRQDPDEEWFPSSNDNTSDEEDDSSDCNDAAPAAQNFEWMHRERLSAYTGWLRCPLKRGLPSSLHQDAASSDSDIADCDM